MFDKVYSLFYSSFIIFIIIVLKLSKYSLDMREQVFEGSLLMRKCSCFFQLLNIHVFNYHKETFLLYTFLNTIIETIKILLIFIFTDIFNLI